MAIAVLSRLCACDCGDQLGSAASITGLRLYLAIWYDDVKDQSNRSETFAESPVSTILNCHRDHAQRRARVWVGALCYLRLAAFPLCLLMFSQRGLAQDMDLFQTTPTFSVGRGPAAIVTCDLNEDGFPSLSRQTRPSMTMTEASTSRPPTSPPTMSRYC